MTLSQHLWRVIALILALAFLWEAHQLHAAKPRYQSPADEQLFDTYTGTLYELRDHQWVAITPPPQEARHD